MNTEKLEGSLQTSLIENVSTASSKPQFVSIETEIPEALYIGMKDFIGANPTFDQYGVMSSAIANFLYQNGCSDRAVTEQYLNDLFSLRGDL